MSLLSNIFGKSPFGPLLEHTKKVHECVELVRPLCETWLRGDFDQIDDIHNQISRIEHEADVIKTTIRRNIGKAYFLAVERTDLLHFLHSQDAIADTVEDLAVILDWRNTTLPAELHEQVLGYVDLATKASEKLLKAADSMNVLVERAFGGPEQSKVLEDIEALNKQEWEVDRAARQLIKKMFTLEDRMSPVDIFIAMKIFEVIGDLANHAENTGEHLALMIIRR